VADDTATLDLFLDLTEQGLTIEDMEAALPPLEALQASALLGGYSAAPYGSTLDHTTVWRLKASWAVLCQLAAVSQGSVPPSEATPTSAYVRNLYRRYKANNRSGTP
jgi:hypothetical protein